MVGRLQNGIYYGPNQQVGNSYCSIFFRIPSSTSAQEAGTIIAKLWETLKDLERGIVKYSSSHPRKTKSGNLTSLLGFSPRIFSLGGVLRNKPSIMNELWFNTPDPKGGGPLFEGSSMYYGTSVHDNHVLEDHMIIQFIADNEFYIHRAFGELWRDLHRLCKLTAPRRILQITRFYTGFKRDDKRSWLGFHDGVSNMKSAERLSAIAISRKKLNSQDEWTANGTYMAFARITINLQAWDDTDTEKQEIIIGRDKKTGCPLVGIDRNGKPVKHRTCPIPGTADIFDRGNERFRDHPPYGYQNLPAGISDKPLELSHIGITRKIPGMRDRRTSPRIYRQSFEFIEPPDEISCLKFGLNFVSFQWSPTNFFNSLRYPSSEEIYKDRFEDHIPTLEYFLSVESGGIFFVPPIENGDLFPGSRIFLDKRKRVEPRLFN